MKFNKIKKAAALITAGVLILGMASGCGSKETAKGTDGEEVVTLIWYQDGDAQKDTPQVLEKINEYTREKIGVEIKINNIGWGDYNQ